MAFARDVYTATAGQTDFTVSYSYEDEDHVEVYKNGTLQPKGAGAAWDFPNPTTVRLSSGAADGDTIVIQRNTSQSTRLVDFTPGILTEDDLDSSAIQMFYMAQEAMDQTDLALKQNTAGLWDATSLRILNVDTPTGVADAATKGYVDATILGTTGQAAEVEVQTATASQTVFTLTDISYTPGINNLAVFVNGLRQAPNDYTETDATTVTFTSGLSAGDEVIFVTATIVTTAITEASAVQFTQNGTGAVARSIESKMQELVSVKDFGATGDGTTDDTTFIQAALDASRNVFFPPGTYKVTATLDLPAMTTTSNNNAVLEGHMVIRGAGMTQTAIEYSGTGYCFNAADTGVSGPRTGIQMDGFTLRGASGNTASGGIRLQNARMARVRDLHIHSFPSGDGLTLYADGTGGSWYASVDSCFFGWWKQDGTAFVYGTDNTYWLQRGIVIDGLEDGSGKSNEHHISNCALWNCSDAAIDNTGHDSDGNAGVPDSTQSGLLGGGGGSVLSTSTIYALECMELESDGVASATSTTVVLDATASATDDIYNGLFVTITSGQGKGQWATINDYNGTTKTITIEGDWDVIPHGTSEENPSSYNVGTRPVGIRMESEGGMTCYGMYTEKVTIPVHLTAYSDFNFHWFGGNMKNSNGIFFFIDPTHTGTAQAGAATTITLASTGSTLDDYYNGRFVSITSGTGNGQVRKITDYDGGTKVATVGTNWGTNPDATSVYELLEGEIPGTAFISKARGAPEKGAGFTNIMHRDIMLHDSSAIGNPTSILSLYLNDTGKTLVSGEVARVKTSGATKALGTNTGAAADMPVAIVNDNNDNDTFADGENVPVARAGSEVKVWCRGNVTPTDTMVSSGTDMCAATDNAQTEPKVILGHALGSSSGTDTTNRVISGITQASPPVVTVTTTHSIGVGDFVTINDVVGMTEVNQQFFKVSAVTATTLTLADLDGNDIDATGYTAWSSAGTVREVVRVLVRIL
jgi:hypothetical protein